MSRQKYEWCVEFYGSGLLIRKVYVMANDRLEAIRKVRESGETIVEMICCRRTDTW